MGENFNYYTFTVYSSSVPTTAETVSLNVPCVHTHLFIGSLYSVIRENGSLFYVWLFMRNANLMSDNEYGCMYYLTPKQWYI
jgi:hypothetical protein